LKEKPEDRLKRLRARKGILLGRMKNLRLSSGGIGPLIRNADHKRNLLNDEVNRIGARIIKIQGAIERSEAER